MRESLRRLLCLAVAVVFVIPIGSNAAPRPPKFVPRGAGVLSSSNVSLVATVPETGGVGGRFVDRYFFMTGYTGLRIFDVTNPELPVLTGALTVPLWENEDVDVSVTRKLVLMTVDNVDSDVGGGLYVASWQNPRVPQLLAFMPYPSTTGNGNNGPGHIASCISDCAQYAYISGARDGSIYVVDLMDPSKPFIAGTVPATVDYAGRGNGAFKGGVVHNIDADPDGQHVWATGSGGTSMLDVSDPLHPTQVYSTPTAENDKWDQFIHHNSLRFDSDTVLVTEEDWLQPLCGGAGTGQQGGFQTWKIPSTATGELTEQNQWITELGDYVDGGAAATVTCSSHWFTFNEDKVVAVGWYDQGVRFLDVSDPTHIKQVGYWIRPSEGIGASAGLFVPGHPDLAYVPDYERGLDVLRIDRGGAGAATVRAPIRDEWITPGFKLPVTSDRRFGWACLLPALPAV